MTHHPFFLMLQVFLANVFSVSSSCVIKYLLWYFFKAWCVGQSYFDVFISDFAVRCRCALRESANDVNVGSIAEHGKTSSSSGVQENGMILLLSSRNAKE